jgi:hypothetical protein
MGADAVRILGGGTSLVVKLHPGHRDWGWVTDAVQGTPARVALREPIEPLLAAASATVVLRSTVATDALAAGCPVVLVRVRGALSGADLELRDAGLPVANSPAELASAIEAIAGETRRLAYFAEREASVRRLIGPQDAVDRVMRLALGASDDQDEAVPSSAT